MSDGDHFAPEVKPGGSDHSMIRRLQQHPF
jgi:hypothetical protein